MVLHIENGVRVSEDDIEKSNSDSSIQIATAHESEMELPSQSSDLAMSGYESDNFVEAINDSDEEIPDDPLGGWSNVEEVRVPVNQTEKFMLKVGQVFVDINEFRKVLKEYSIREGIRMVRDKDEKSRVTVHCFAKPKGCKWRVHASPLPDGITYAIKSCESKHTCVRVDHLKETNSEWIAEKLVPIMRAHPTMKTKGLLTELKKMGCEPNYMQLWRAKKKASEKIDGNHSDSYTLLPKYAEMVKSTNPGSILAFQYEVIDNSIPIEPIFKRFFLGIDALKNGFLEACQPFIGFDGCHLKGHCGGVLLSAVAIDGNLGLYPLAIAVVETENKESWGFFFNCLKNMLGGFGDEKPWTFMTDRQKGLVEVIKERTPNVINRKCCRHIYANMRRVYPGIIVKKLFWAAARAYTVEGFNTAMNKLKEVKPGAFKWLVGVGDSTLWARHARSTQLKNDHVTNNISESFNHWIGDLRPKPILKLVDGFRSKIMHRVQTRYQKGSKWPTQVCERVLKKLNTAKEEAIRCEIMVGGTFEFQVSYESINYIVNLDARSCDCREWDLSGIPCKHAAAAITYKRHDIESYVHQAYSKDMFLKGYSHKVFGVPDPSFWPEMADLEPKTLRPPLLKRKPGRPKKHRRRETGEQPRSIPSRRNPNVQCGSCGGTGHNKRTCERNANSRGTKRNNEGSIVETMGDGNGSQPQTTQS